MFHGKSTHVRLLSALVVTLLLQGCAHSSSVAPTASRIGAHGIRPDVKQTPPIGPTPPPNGNFMLEFPIPTSQARPRGIKHCGMNLCVAEFGASKIDILTTTGVFAEYSTPTANSGPFGVTEGADKNFWFTESTANNIGRLTQSGVITEYPVPTAGSDPTAIWNGKKSTRLVWFTESAANKIASINVDTGSVVEYPLPTPNSDPDSIAQDFGGGQMWFIEHAANKVGVITPTGVITEIDIPTKQSGADDITAVEDGNVWMTEPSIGKIARVDVRTHVITEFAVPYANSRPIGITEGDTFNHGYDGNGDPFTEQDDQVWFSDDGVNAVSGYNYRTGVFNIPIKIPTGRAGAGEISYAADNNIWYVEKNTNQVGVYHLPTPPPASTH